MTEPEETTWVCAICGRVLDRTLATSRYQHTFADAKVQNHEAVPVEVPLSQANLRCDFCHDDVSVFNASTVVSAEFRWLGNLMSADWVANPACAELVQADDWDGLLARGVDGWERRHGPMEDYTKQMITNMYAEVRKGFVRMDPPPPMPQEAP